MDWIGLSCDYVKFLAIAAILIGIFSNPFGLRNRINLFPRKWGFPAVGLFFVLIFTLMASDQC